MKSTLIFTLSGEIKVGVQILGSACKDLLEVLVFVRRLLSVLKSLVLLLRMLLWLLFLFLPEKIKLVLHFWTILVGVQMKGSACKRR